jgi:hypothetical protein
LAITIAELRDAFEFANLGDEAEAQAYVDRQTGRVYTWMDPGIAGDDQEPLPDDIESERYLEIPDKRDLNLGKYLALDFADAHMPADADDVRAIFSRRGAYGRFKSLLQRRGMLDAWYAFESEAEDRALRAWCADEGLELSD